MTTAAIFAQDEAPAQVLPTPGNQVFITQDILGDVVDGYWLYLPREYDKSMEWPVILFLQGGTGIGPDPGTSKLAGPAAYAMMDLGNREFKSYVKDSFIIINAHMRPGSYWERQYYQQYSTFNEILDAVIGNYSGDPDRVYLTGLSRGGNGTWGLAQTLSHRFAAIVPICGRIHGVTDFSSFDSLPIWIAHCTGDHLHKYQESLEAVRQIEAYSGSPFLHMKDAAPKGKKYLEAKHIFTTFERDSHDAWSETYSQVQLYKWLLSKRKHNLVLSINSGKPFQP